MIENMDSHKTPATFYPLGKIGVASLKHQYYKPGYYSWEFIKRPRGSEPQFEITKRLCVTHLQIKGKTWMVDDPLHWYGMKEFVSRSIPGRPLLLVGLGLGLAVWHAVETQVSDIFVLDICQDVIDLIKPNLPKDERIQILHGDFYDVPSALPLAKRIGNGTVLWDLAVGETDKTYAQFQGGKIYLDVFYHKARCMMFGAKFGKSLILHKEAK